MHLLVGSGAISSFLIVRDHPSPSVLGLLATGLSQTGRSTNASPASSKIWEAYAPHGGSSAALWYQIFEEAEHALVWHADVCVAHCASSHAQHVNEMRPSSM